jgi:hypothetical protein
VSVTIFVPDIPEFAPLVDSARRAAGCRVVAPLGGYWRIESDTEINLERRALGLGPALWNSALSGGFVGRIIEYGRDRLCIAAQT